MKILEGPGLGTQVANFFSPVLELGSWEWVIRNWDCSNEGIPEFIVSILFTFFPPSYLPYYWPIILNVYLMNDSCYHLFA